MWWHCGKWSYCGNVAVESNHGRPVCTRCAVPYLVLASRAYPQMSGFGGVVSFEIDGDRQKTSEFVDSVCLPYMG